MGGSKLIRRVALALATFIALSGVALAQYPQRPVKLVVPAAPGGGTDVQARYLASRLSERLGRQFVIENVGAAGGNVAAAQVAKSDPDGYTLMLIAPATVINNALYTNPGYDAAKDFVQVAAWAQSPLMFIGKPSLAAATLQELTANAKANPGKLSFGSGPGFINHMVMELYKIEAGTDIVFVPYRGQAPALTDVMGGQIDLTVDTIASAGAFIEDKKVKALAITSAQRSSAFPSIPTVTEAGYPKLTGNTWYGLLAPAKTPADIVARLSAEIGAIQAEPDSVQRIKAMGAEPFIAGSVDFTRFYQDELAKWAGVIKSSGLKIN